MRIAIAQIAAIKGNIEKNIENHLKWIKLAIQNNAGVLVFPELSLTGYEPELAEILAPYLGIDKSVLTKNLSKSATVILLKKDVSIQIWYLLRSF